ncbi:MAG: PrgI family mobile element protein [Gaiellaceae bacterium]
MRLPADVELEDRLAFGLTARQLLLLFATALAAYGGYAFAATIAPLPLAVAAAAPLALAGTLLSLGRFESLPADRLALAALRHLRTPRRRVLAPQGLPAPLALLPTQRKLAPLDLPVRSVLRSGLIELDGGCFALLLRASGTGFSLRSEEEQTALVEAFGRFLNALAEPIEIVVRSEPVELAPLLARLQEQADVLPVAALAEAARAHLRFLSELAAREGVRRREILLVLSTRAREKQSAQLELMRRAGEAQELLRAAGVELRSLDGDQAAALLARALDPPGPPLGATLEGVVRAC